MLLVSTLHRSVAVFGTKVASLNGLDLHRRDSIHDEKNFDTLKCYSTCIAEDFTIDSPQ